MVWQLDADERQVERDCAPEIEREPRDNSDEDNNVRARVERAEDVRQDGHRFESKVGHHGLGMPAKGKMQKH